MKDVQILLSTYNGARYLQPLLESLTGQDYPAVSVLVRDDGSTDGTPEMLRAYAMTHKNVQAVFGENLGFIGSFFELLRIADSGAHYYALCDQDDIWKPDKVSRAVQLLSVRPSDAPVLYCSRLTVVSEDLEHIGYSDIPKRGLSFPNAIVENQVRGCTSVLNRPARKLLAQTPQSCVSHDWWMYLVVSALGTLVYDGESRILYRQHPSNQFGITIGIIETWKNKIRQFLKDGRSNLIAKQAEEFWRTYGSSLPVEHRLVIERFVRKRRFWNRLRYALSCDVYRQSPRDQYLLKLRIIFGWL
jgi:glycosyltransferase involved in cell wall biosynthesis